MRKEERKKDSSEINLFRRKIIKISFFSSPVIYLFFDSAFSKAQATTPPPPIDLPAPKIKKIIQKKKQKRESIRRLRPLEGNLKGTRKEEDIFSIKGLDSQSELKRKKQMEKK